jgi:hypothetical protein
LTQILSELFLYRLLDSDDNSALELAISEEKTSVLVAMFERESVREMLVHEGVDLGYAIRGAIHQFFKTNLNSDS